MIAKDKPRLAPTEPAATAAGVEAYLAASLNTTVRLEPWPDLKGMPVHLAQSFTYMQTTLLGKPVVMVLDQGLHWTPRAIGKQLHIIEQVARRPAVFVPVELSPVNRARLISQGTAFIVPSHSMFLPPLGLALAERTRSAGPRPGSLGVASQVVVIHALCRKIDRDFSAQELMESLDYTRMTMTRVFKELASNGLASVQLSGRRQILHFNFLGKELWNHAQGLLVSPVRKRVWVSSAVDIRVGLKAGLSALADRTNLAAPSIPVVAIPPTGGDWAGLRGTRQNINNTYPMPEEDSTEVELWTYPPALLTKDRAVDPFSLCLSLRTEGDERVEQALELLEAGLW